MDEGVITSLINLGAAGAVIIVTIYFLRFIKDRDSQWQTFFDRLMSSDKAIIEAMLSEMKSLHGDFSEHDVWEHTKLDEMSAALKKSPRKIP